MDERATFYEAAAAYVAIAEAVDTSQLDLVGTDAWSVRELVAHGARGIALVASTIATPVDPATPLLDGAVGYVTAAMASPGVHVAIELRAREDAAGVGDDPGGYVRRTLAAVRPVLDAADLGGLVQHRAGRLVLSEYLRTRTMELTLHGVDLQRACGRPVAFPEGPAAQVRDLLVALIGRADALSVACALSGRSGALACNVLG